MQIDHYTVHVGPADPGPNAVYSVTPPHNTADGALAESITFQKNRPGCSTFITARNSKGEILFVLPVAEYPASGVTSLTDVSTFDEVTPKLVTAFIEDMDWTV